MFTYRISEYCLCTGDQICLPGAWRRWNCEHVVCDFCGRGRYDYCGAERGPRAQSSRFVDNSSRRVFVRIWKKGLNMVFFTDTGDVHDLFNHMMKRLCFLRFARAVIGFLSLPAGFDQSAGAQ